MECRSPTFQQHWNLRNHEDSCSKSAHFNCNADVFDDLETNDEYAFNTDPDGSGTSNLSDLTSAGAAAQIDAYIDEGGEDAEDEFIMCLLSPDAPGCGDVAANIFGDFSSCGDFSSPNFGSWRV